MSIHFPTVQEIETELGIIKVDINTVVAKAASYVQLALHEIDALVKWGVSQGGNVEAVLKAATPIISEVGAAATLVATKNPAAAAEVAKVISGVNAALLLAQKSAEAMNAANTALQASAAQGALVSDTTAIAAGVQAMTGANSHASSLLNIAVQAAKSVQALATPAAP